jgi:hypothetical protein
VGLCGLAGEVLVQMGSVAVDAVATLLDSPSGTLRKIAVDLLALMPAQRQAAKIAVLLDDPDSNVRLAAVDALGLLGGIEYAEPIRTLYDRDPSARPHVLEALSKFGRAEDLPLLETALLDEDPVVQLCAVEALSNHGGPAIPRMLLDRLERVDPMARPIVLQAIVAVLDRYPDRTIGDDLRLRDELIRVLDDPNHEYRHVSAQGLRFFSDDRSLLALLAHAGQDDAVDLITLDVLSQRPNALDTLLRAYVDGKITPEGTVTFIMGLFARAVIPADAHKRAAAFVAQCFQYLDADTKMGALDLARTLDLPALKVILDSGLSDPDPTVRSLAEDIVSR